VNESLLDRVVPSFVLQPLVENAIRHGVAPRARGGIVAIQIAKDNGTLILTVDDDNPTIGAPTTDSEVRGSGVGLRLLRDRIEAMYGETASLLTCRSPLDGFRVQIRLPTEPVGEEALAL
jgi:two-component system LytT family sensor kinase